MEFYVLDKNYVSFLKAVDSRVGDAEYGINRMKFHLGVVCKGWEGLYEENFNQ